MEQVEVVKWYSVKYNDSITTQDSSGENRDGCTNGVSFTSMAESGRYVGGLHRRKVNSFSLIIKTFKNL